VIEGEEVDASRLCRRDSRIQFDLERCSGPLTRAMRAGVIDQNPAHHPCSGAEKVRAVLPGHSSLAE